VKKFWLKVAAEVCASAVGLAICWAGLRCASCRLWFVTAVADGPGVVPGLKGFRKRQRKQRKTLGCGVNRPGESGDYGVVDEGLVTYRAQGWAAISAWSWVVV
jgi:hypothetical protein